MSTLATRIRAIRAALGMTREGFGDKIGIPGRTIEGIESEGRIPRGDVLEGIANALPQFAYWLLTQKTDGANHIAPLGDDHPTNRNNYLRVIDRVDARDIQNTIVKECEFKTINFIQSKTEESNLAVLIELKQSRLYQSSSTPNFTNIIWIDAGILNFDSDHGGKNALNAFRDYLSQIDFDLIAKSQLYEIDEKILRGIYKSLTLRSDDLLTPDENKKTYSRFLAWQQGEAPYDH